jgi:hypothetical protein
MTHPLFRQDIFVETAFARRFQAMLRSAWSNRAFHVIVADPGAGKTMSIRDLRKTADGRSMLTITTPKNNEEEQALGDQLYTALGLPLRGYWPTRKPKLMGHLHQYGTEFLVLRRDTLRIIDGEGSGSEAPSSASPSVAQTSETETEQVSSPQASSEPSPISPTEQADQPRSGEEVAIPPTASIKCTFLGVVPIDIKCFAESGVSLVECPDCGRTWTLSPRGGVVRFKSHDKRKTTTSNTAERWAMRETIWKVVGGENK